MENNWECHVKLYESEKKPAVGNLVLWMSVRVHVIISKLFLFGNMFLNVALHAY